MAVTSIARLGNAIAISLKGAVVSASHPHAQFVNAALLHLIRHTCIMYRLIYGDGMDLLTLATNARKSVDMIARFYASQLTGEMNIDMIQSRRARRLQRG